MRVFITGAAGFIGRRLVDCLLERGDQVTALTRRADHNLPAAVQVVQGDLFAAEVLRAALEGIDRLYHLAALITFDPARRPELMHINGRGTREILRLAGKSHIPRCVVVSSACTIGISFSSHRILDEDAVFEEELARRNPYLASKRQVEQAAMEAAQDHEVIIVNPTTVYGPGDWSLNSGTLIQKIASANVLPVPPGGSNVVDVDDVVEGILLAGERGLSDRRYILGGENLSFSEIFNIIAKTVDYRPRWVPLPRWMRHPAGFAAKLLSKLFDSRFLTEYLVEDLFAYKYYSSARAESALGWRRQFTFEQSVRRAWQFYRQEALITEK